MFTGLIQELGSVVAWDQIDDTWLLTISGSRALDNVRHGDSIAVNGLCLTVVDLTGTTFSADVMQISIDTSTLSDLEPGDPVNLESAAEVGSKLGGHIVQGHIDGTATVLRVIDAPGQRTLRFTLDPAIAPLIARKGSIALDGVSLTVSAVSDAAEPSQWFEVSLIPDTVQNTTLGLLVEGERVNVETDIVARHVARMLEFKELR